MPSKALIIGAPLFLLYFSHIKSLPLGYTLRSWLVLRSLVKKARKNQLCPEPLFSVTSLDHRCFFDDMDYNQHMNNSSYNKVLDFSRIQTLYTVFCKAMMEPEHNVFCHNAGVVTLFKKEIPPFQKYTVESRVFSWNEKWLFLEHRFIYKVAGQDQPVLACRALSKMVFKLRNGKTLSPDHVLRLCGHDLADPAIEQQRALHWTIADHFLSLNGLFDTTKIVPWHAKL
ncbi:hypothetical protein DM01DRAFT_1320104 [Hesseltinella vesiculosa]|uniref:Thioesterase/thiol ester dehydrase-isomerase n=1 Tax=Hesseltinella vesiculosa TaxID=101127 RepID=A0A1X2GM73_9FUNG|nr:hypothetical protein DM01DRAFT_1320104 [Hesseltinella vesiculosa]